MNDRDKTEEALGVDLEGISFTDLFNLEELQRFQDLFADVHEVASVITHPDGSLITNPSNFTRFCKDIIRKTEKGCINCYISDSILGRNNPTGPIVQPCLSGGLLDAGVSITVGGKHIANWLIGQVRNDEMNEEKLLDYADQIGANREDFRQALNEVPKMSDVKFNKIAQLLFIIANELSVKSFNKLKFQLQIKKDEIVKKQLEESEEKYKKAFQNSSDAININHRDGSYITVNDGFTNLTGFTQEDVEGKLSTEINIWAIPEDYETLRTGINEKGSVKNLESIFRCKDGSLLTAIISAEIIILNNEPHILTMTRDITDRKKMEELILKSKQQYENLVSNIPVGVYILLTNAEGTFTLEYVSPRMAEMLDLSIEYLMSSGDAIFKAIHPDDLDSFVRLNQEGIQQKKPFDWKGRTIIKGNVRWLHFRSLPQELENGDTYWHGLIVDITERMMAEAEIKYQNSELVKLDAEKDKFFSIIAHDLRSPFNSFLGLTQIMAEDLPSLTMAKIQEIAVKMSNSATNLYRLLENLLEWSQIKNGAFSFKPEVIQLSLVVDGCIDMILVSAKNKDIEIVNDIAAGVEVFADRNMIQTIIRNLLSNALKFTPKGGKISFSAKSIDRQSIEIYVKDTGIGLSRDLIDNLFRIDMKTNRLGTEDEPSTGLGLLLCKEFVEKQGGKIQVESEVGKGSTFSFSIPMA
jgi:PAS domain S-box-containing protein